MTTREAADRGPLISVANGLYTAIAGALGNVLLLLGIPVGPNLHLELMNFSSVLVGSTHGWFLGMVAGFIAGLYTPVLWGWFGAIPHNMIFGALTGLLATRVGLRPFVAGTIAALISLLYVVPALYYILGISGPLLAFATLNVVLELTVVSLAADGVIRIPGLRKRFPKGERHRATSWVSRLSWLRHPWLDTAGA